MQKIIIVLVAVAVLATILAYAEGQKTTSSTDWFVSIFSEWMERRGHQVTPELEQALRDVHPLLVTASRDKLNIRFFWTYVNNEKIKEIEWEEAKRLILKGEIIMVQQEWGGAPPHRFRVVLTGLGGEEYATIEPKIDDVLHVVKTVDPKMVFIKQLTVRKSRQYIPPFNIGFIPSPPYNGEHNPQAMVAVGTKAKKK